MADTVNFGWTKPTVGGDTGAWGTILNTLFDDIDTDLEVIDDQADATDAAVAALDTRVDAAELYLVGTVIKSITIPGSMFTGDSVGFDISYSGGFLSYSYSGPLGSVAGQAVCPLVLPVGVTINSVEVSIDPSAATTITLRRINLVTGLDTLVATVASGITGGMQLVTVGINHVVLNGESYYLNVAATFPAIPNMLVYGARITYSVPDVRKTL
jgi:hypothetical protein